MAKTSMRSNRVFRSEESLSPQYVPDMPVGRDAEVAELRSALETMARRSVPENVWVHGRAGMGKTSCVRHALEQVEDETGLKPVYINCWQYNSRSALITELLIQLGYPAVRRGKSVDELVSKLEIWLDRNRDVAVALDEVDQLDDLAEVLYDLQHVDAAADNDLGIVMVSNQPPDEVTLDQRTESRLSYRTVEFEPYSADQIEDILKHRVERAFRPGAVTGEVIPRIAAHVAEEDGDCRSALKLLLEAGRTAEREGHDTVTGAHLPVERE